MCWTAARAWQADGVEAAAGPEGWREEALALARLGYAVMLTELRALLQDGDPGLSPALGWRLLAPSPSGARPLAHVALALFKPSRDCVV